MTVGIISESILRVPKEFVERVGISQRIREVEPV
jgi:hypothetical protein